MWTHYISLGVGMGLGGGSPFLTVEQLGNYFHNVILVSHVAHI